MQFKCKTFYKTNLMSESIIKYLVGEDNYKQEFLTRIMFDQIYNKIIKDDNDPIIIYGLHNTGKTILTYQLLPLPTNS